MTKSDASHELLVRMEQVSMNLKELTDIFSRTTKKFETTPGNAILDKLDKIYTQNEKIASAVLSLIEIIKDKLVHGSPTTPAHQLASHEAPSHEEGIPAFFPQPIMQRMQQAQPSLSPGMSYPQFHHELPPPPLPPGKMRMPVHPFEEPASLQPLKPIQPIAAPQAMTRMSLEERKRKLGIT